MTSGSLTLRCVELKNQDSLYTSEHLLHYWHETRQKQTLMSLFFVTAVFRFSPVTHQLFSLFCSLLLLPSNTCSFIHFLCLRSIKCKVFYVKSFSVASAPTVPGIPTRFPSLVHLFYHPCLHCCSPLRSGFTSDYRVHTIRWKAGGGLTFYFSLGL